MSGAGGIEILSQFYRYLNLPQTYPKWLSYGPARVKIMSACIVAYILGYMHDAHVHVEKSPMILGIPQFSPTITNRGTSGPVHAQNPAIMHFAMCAWLCAPGHALWKISHNF